MAKKAKSAKKRIGRPEGRKPLLNLRVDQSLHDRLAAAAASAGRTISEETVSRLARSLGNEEVFGSELRQVVDMVGAAFWLGGKQAAISGGHKDWAPRDWLQDQDCYRSAFVKAAVTMIECMPVTSPDEKSLALVALHGRLTSGLVDSGELQFLGKDGKPMKPGFQGGDE